MSWNLSDIGYLIAIGIAVAGFGVAWNNQRRDVKKVDEKTEANSAEIAVVKKIHDNCPITKVATDVDWLKQIWVSDTKSRHEELWAQHSPLQLTEQALSIIPENIKKAIDDTSGTYSEIIEHVRSMKIPEDDLIKLARERKLPVSALIFVINDYARLRAEENNNG